MNRIPTGRSIAAIAVLLSSLGASAGAAESVGLNDGTETVADTAPGPVPGAKTSVQVAQAGGRQSPVANEPASRTAGLEEIIVVARKREENIQTVPISITTVSAAELTNQSVRTLNQMQELIPGLILQQSNDDPQSLAVTMRGRKQSDVGLAIDPAVGLYVDDVYIPRTIGLTGALVDIDHVEALRGPQGTLYGRNTTGGAVSIHTKDPTTDAYSGSLDVTGGNYGAWNVIGIANLPITDDLAARFVAQKGGNDGYGHNYINHPLQSDDSQYYRVKLLWKSGGINAVLSGHYDDNYSGGTIANDIFLVPAQGGAPAGAPLTFETAAETGLTIPQSVAYLQSLIARSHSDFYNTAGTTLTSSYFTRWDGSLNITAELPAGLQFRSITGVQGLERHVTGGAPIPVTYVISGIHNDDKYYSQEFQVLGSTPTIHWIGGLYGGYERGHDDTFISVFPVINPGVNATNAGIYNTSYAAFGQATWEFLPAWHLTAGARYSSDTRRADDVVLLNATCLIPAPGVESTNLGPAQCPRTFQNTFNKPTWLASLDHQLTDNVLLYVKAATGYRSGGQNIGGSVEIETFAPFQPETNLEYEGGIKSQFFDNKVRLNLDVFHDDYSNLQVSTLFYTADGSLSTAYTNAAKATIQGFEAEATVQATSQLSLHGYATYTDAYYKQFVDASGDRSGEPFPVPKWTYGLSGRYVQPTSLGDLGLELDYDGRSATVFDGTAMYRDQVTQPAYRLLNARLDLTIKAWDINVALFGRNITAVKYFDQMLGPGLGTYFGYAAEPAIYGAEIIKKFGK